MGTYFFTTQAILQYKNLNSAAEQIRKVCVKHLPEMFTYDGIGGGVYNTAEGQIQLSVSLG